MRNPSLVGLLVGVALLVLSWDRGFAQEPKPRSIITGDALDVLSVAFSPDGKTLASCGRAATIKLWDVATGKNTAALQADSGDLWSVAFSPDGKLLASPGGKDRGVLL